MSIALPLHRLPATADAANVLLVQSDALNRQTCALALTEAGFSVKHTAERLRAWEEAFTWPASIIVADLALPGLDGLELCRRLRRDARTADSLIVGLSKSPGVSEYLTAVRIGFDLLLNQPCDPRLLLGEIMHVRILAASARRRSELARARAVVARTEATVALERNREVLSRSIERMTRQSAVAKIRSAYLQLPGLMLTPDQAARLWDMDGELCTAVLEELLRRKFLMRVENQYSRATANAFPLA
jgi:DNA-binding response OmpR family regulator